MAIIVSQCSRSLPGNDGHVVTRARDERHLLPDALLAQPAHARQPVYELEAVGREGAVGVAFGVTVGVGEACARAVLLRRVEAAEAWAGDGLEVGGGDGRDEEGFAVGDGEGVAAGEDEAGDEVAARDVAHDVGLAVLLFEKRWMS